MNAWCAATRPARRSLVASDALARLLWRHAAGNHPKSDAIFFGLVDALKTTAEQALVLHADRVDFASLQRDSPKGSRSRAAVGLGRQPGAEPGR